MNRLAERIVSNGSSAASARARVPTTTSPSGRKLTADGSSNSAVSGFGRQRGPSASSTATRLLVVPRSMPTTRAILDPERLVDVGPKGVEIGELGEPALELREDGRRVGTARVPGGI